MDRQRLPVGRNVFHDGSGDAPSVDGETNDHDPSGLLGLCLADSTPQPGSLPRLHYHVLYGVPLASFLSVLILLKPSPDAAYYLALMGMVVFLSGLVQVRDLHELIAGNANDYTYDFIRNEKTIGSKGNNVYLNARIPYSNKVEEFYLPDQYLAPLSISDFVITSDTGYPRVNLTPDNTVVYLFRKM